MAATAALLAACLNVDPLTRAASDRLDAFDFYWQRLADDYPLFGQRPVDWEALRRRYRGAVPFAQRPHEFYHLLTGMLSELGDLHVSLTVPPAQWAADGVAATSLLDLPGFEVMPIEGRLHVVGWPPGAAPVTPEGLAADARHPELWRVGGFPVVLSLVGNLLLGPPESPVELQLRWRNGTVTRHVLQRPAAGTRIAANPFGHLDDHRMQWLVRSSEPFTWMELRSLDHDLPIDRIDTAIDRARSGDGLVLDLRRNRGGLWRAAQRIVERFLREEIELVLVPPHPTTSLFGLLSFELFVQDVWRPRPPVFDRPLVVLTSAMTGSAAEHLARVLQRYAGASVVGERTAGAEAALQTEVGPDGGELRFGAIRVVDRTGAGLQEEGVVPDVSVRLTLDDLDRLGPERAAADWERRLLDAARSRFYPDRGAAGTTGEVRTARPR